MYIPALGSIHGISMVYTMDIPSKIFIGVPDVCLFYNLCLFQQRNPIFPNWSTSCWFRNKLRVARSTHILALLSWVTKAGFLLEVNGCCIRTRSGGGQSMQQPQRAPRRPRPAKGLTSASGGLLYDERWGGPAHPLLCRRPTGRTTSSQKWVRARLFA